MNVNTVYVVWHHIKFLMQLSITQYPEKQENLILMLANGWEVITSLGPPPVWNKLGMPSILAYLST